MRLPLLCCFVALACVFVRASLVESPDPRGGDSRAINIPALLLRYLMNIYAPTTATNQTCREHSLQYAKGMEEFKSWAWKMFDSSTKLPDGILVGMIRQLGNYDECVGVTAPDEGFGSFTGQHCFVRLQPVVRAPGRGMESSQHLPLPLQQYLTSLDAVHEQQTRIQARSAIPLPPFLGFHWSFCVPSTCSAEEVSAHFTKTLGFLGVTAIANEGDCNVNGKPPLQPLDWAFIAVLIVLVSLAVLSTAYDVLATQSDSRRPLFLAFSIHTNGQRMLSTSTTGSDTLGALSGIRFLSICWVVYAHTWLAAAMFPNINIPFVQEFFDDNTRQYILNGTVSVDSFFLLSGTLLSYIFLKEMQKGTSFNVPLFYLHRYLRLTPAVAAMILFEVSFAERLGSGPTWNSIFPALGSFCKDNWWTNLLYVQNYVHQDRMCVPQTWYLAVDMQLFLFSPLLLYPLWKWPRVGEGLLILAFLGGVSSTYTTHYLKKTSMVATQNDFATHSRTTVWLIGLGLGLLLHNTKGKRPRLNKWVVCALWGLALFLTIGILYMPAAFTTPSYEYVQGVDAIWEALFRPLWGLGLAIIIFCCVHGYGGFINSFLSWRGFIPLARLSYCLYLTHMSVQMGLLAVMKTPREITDSVVVPQFFSDLVISIGFSVILFLLVEMPFINLERLLFRKGSTNKAEKGVV